MHTTSLGKSFAFLVETCFCHVAQANLKLLSPGDPHALASQVLELQAWVTARSPNYSFLNEGLEKIRMICMGDTFLNRGMLQSYLFFLLQTLENMIV